MIEIVWEITVQPDAQGQLELVFGPGGAWSKLFGGSPGFRGATLLHDMHHPRRYLVIDLWDTDDQREQALADCAADYATLEADLERWIESRSELGVFRVRAEATVRPRGKPSRRNR